jgi:hypothetical protein
MEYGVKNEERGKWETLTVGYEIWLETLKNLKNESGHCGTWNMANILENEIQWETLTIGPEIWLESLKKVINETQTLFDL